MDLLRSSLGITRMENVETETIKGRTGILNTSNITEHLKWCGHMQRMTARSLPKQVYVDSSKSCDQEIL